MQKKITLALVGLCLAGVQGSAQLSRGGEPLHWSDKSISPEIPFATMPSIDVQALQDEDAVTDLYKEAPYRFGVEHDVHFDFNTSGNWALYPEQNLAVWQLGIRCPGAVSINLLFTDFHLPKGGKLFIWSGDREQFLGSFDHRDNNPNSVFPTGLLYASEIVVEYQVPLDQDWGAFTLAQVVHGYRPILESHFALGESDRGPYGNSGACNINVNCPEGSDWQLEKRSVALIVQGGSALCTGAMVNNTAQDGTPYFLTANHCLGNVGSWVFYFNHESASCTGNTGPVNNSISGSTLKANNSGSDFALLLLNSSPPEAWNVQWAGWDKTDLEINVTSATCIHHPSGDVKKISFENDAPYHSSAAGAQVWWIDDWELGVTEPGSSGSPLFNQDHRIIGQLYGGASACSGSVGNGQYDYYGRFGISWNSGASSATRLKEWLDPGNSGLAAIDGWPVGFVAYNNDAGITNISGIESTLCGSLVAPVVTLRNYGTQALTSCTIYYQLNGGPLNSTPWTGNLSQNQQVQVVLPTMTAASGTNSLEVYVANPNGVTDENPVNDLSGFSFTALTGEVYEITVSILLDDYPEETSWEITDGNTVLWSGGGYSTGGQLVEQSVCLPVGCYDFTIYDDYGDGLCCAWGNGAYEVIDQFGNTVGSGGTFGSEETTEICVVTSVPSLADVPVLNLFPNPATSVIHIETGFANGFDLEIMDCTGRKVRAAGCASGSWSISTDGLEPGTYFIRVSDNERSVSRSLTILR